MPPEVADHPFTPYPTVPCRVLDPFAGSGTTLVVAERLGLDATGIELNESYARMARERVAVEGAPLFAGEGQDEADDRDDGLMQSTLFA